MNNKIVFAVGEDLPLILAGRIDDAGEIVDAQDITQPVLECSVEYLVSYGKQFTYEFEGSRYVLLAAKIEPDGQAG